MRRGKMPFVLGLTAILLRVMLVPLSYQFPQTSKAAFHYGAVVLALFGLVLVLIAFKVEKRF